MSQHVNHDIELTVRVGELLAGKYRVKGLLGHGAMGVVVAAMHEQLEELVAIKLMLPSGLARPDFVGRFLREARAAVKIKNPHVARVLDAGTLEDGRLYMVIEHLAGKDLAKLIQDRGPLPEGEAVSYVLQACEALIAAHALGIVHRDLKPANLFLTESDKGAPLVKVLDFGISKMTQKSGEKEDARLTASMAIIGSPLYMSPEQIRSARNVDGRADVWALGVILHELITCRVPFLGDTHMSILASIAADPPTLLREHRPDASPGLEAIIQRCLEKDVEKRFQSVEELSRALAPFGLEDAAPSASQAMRVSAPPRSPEGGSGVRVSAPIDAMAETVHTLTESAPSKRRQRLVALATVLAGVAAVAAAAILTSRPAATTGSMTASSSAALSVSAAPSAVASAGPSGSSASPAAEPPSAPSEAPSLAASASAAPLGSGALLVDRTKPDASGKLAPWPAASAKASLPAPRGGIRLGKEVDTRR